MAKVGAQRAAELTGTSKSTIQRAMNAGKLSFETDANGRRIVDVSELERVFPLKPKESTSDRTVEQELEKATMLLETERLKMRVSMLEEQLHSAQEQVTDLKTQRDLWQKQATQVLLTSQYTQKQAEEFRAELKERERRARERREQVELEKKVQLLPQRTENDNAAEAKEPQQDNEAAEEQNGDSQDEGFNFKGFWKRVKGQR